MRRRDGVSLLEVMFSMGVIAVGLLGVTAILPLALNQIGRGRVLDNAARTGQNAATAVRVHRMLDPTSWRAGVTATSGPPRKRSVTVSPSTILNQGFCIDPMFVAVNTNRSDTTFNSSLFPYYSVGSSTTSPRMLRISLAAPTASADSVNPSGMLRFASAERIFVLQDELVFDIPEEKDTPPIQNFGNSRAGRMYNGSTSWIATLSPNLDVTSQVHDAFQLSVVVFNNRNLSMPVDGDSERLLSVDWGLSSGLGGGDLVIQASLVEDLIGIQSGKWIMLMGYVPNGVKQMPQFRWYRVVTTDSEPVYNSTTMLYRLNVTVQGPDWNPTTSTTCVFMPGVVAVYERSVRLESGSLWTN